MANTTIQISQDLKKELSKRKLFDNESYEGVIWDLLEDTMELSEETKRNIKIAEEQIKKGETISHEQLKLQLALNKAVYYQVKA